MSRTRICRWPFSMPTATSPGIPARAAGATCWCFFRARGRFATSARRSGANSMGRSKSSHCIRAWRGSSSGGYSSAAPAGESCWPRTSPKPPSPCPESARSSTPGSRASAATARATGCSGCPSSGCRGRAPNSAKADAAASARGSACGCTRRPISSSVRSSPSRRCCGPISRRCCCGSRPMDSVRPRNSRSSTRRIRARSATVIACCRSCRRSMRSGGSRGWAARWRNCPSILNSRARCLEAKRFHSEAELLAIVSYLSVPDARMADSDGANAIPAAARLLEDAKSEFSGAVRLWRAYRKAREGTRRELRGWCKERGLSLLRLSEWEDVYGQVADRAAGVGIIPMAKPASYAGVHRALLSGFCTSVGTLGEDGAYLGPRGLRFHIFPGLAPEAPPAPLGDGGEHRRDLAGVRAARRRGRAHVDRVGRAAPDQARIPGA